MASGQDYGVQDFGRCRLALRSDLNWMPQLSSGQPYYQVEDPLNSKFFRVGAAEYSFVSLLDGKTSVREAVRQTAIALPNAAFSEQEAAVICRWLLDNGLVDTVDRQAAPSDQSSTAVSASLYRWNPLTVRIPLLHPDRLFESLSPWFQWAFTPLALLAWIAFVAAAVVVVWTDSARFFQSIDGVFAPLTWLLLPVCWLVLKLVHELAHGLACRKFGGSVREAGVILILLIPVTYVDVTSSWRFRSKWQRIITAAAGMYAELAIAAAATFVWWNVGPGIVSNVCCALVIMASVTTLAFNSNFLMKFDGYYVLSDLMEVPNLASLAQQELSHRLLSIVRRDGPPPAARPPSLWKQWFVVGYGVASLCWKTLVCACLVITASTLFDGAGIVLAVVAAAMWVFLPLQKLFKHLVKLRQESSTDSYAYRAYMLATVVVCGLLAVAPWPGAAHTSAVVEYADLCVVRTDSPGFVREIKVHNGQEVQAGQVLVVLQNDELKNELDGLRLSVRQSEIKIRAYEHERHMAAWQAEAKQLESLQQQLQEKISQVDNLVIRAPNSGRVIGRSLDNLAGVFLKSGDTMLSIGREGRKELQIAIPQDDVLHFQEAIDDNLRVRLAGVGPFYCRLVEVAPRATTQCPHAALAATNGGSLPVRATNSETEAEFGDYELVTPYFVGRLDLPPEHGEALRSGQVGTATLLTCDESIGHHLYRTIYRWAWSKWRTAHCGTPLCGVSLMLQ